MPEMWEVNHIGEEKKCPSCGKSLGISGATKKDAELLQSIMDKPCGDMAVTDGSDEEC